MIFLKTLRAVILAQFLPNEQFRILDLNKTLLGLVVETCRNFYFFGHKTLRQVLHLSEQQNSGNWKSEEFDYFYTF